MADRSGTLAAIAVYALFAASALAPATSSGQGSGSRDPAALAERLAAVLRFETISHQDRAQFRGEPFVALLDHLEMTYPQTYATLRSERVNDYSLLLHWPGRNPDLAPALFLSHTDVVPVEPGTEDEWTHPPFAGTVADGIIWGRGTLDVKNGVVAYHEAIGRLLAEGFAPERSLYFAFGHDEEIGGNEGAGRIAALLSERGVHFEFGVDEGGFIVTGSPQLPDRPMAMINVAEKTYFTVHLTARGPGGHSSIPPFESAVGRLSRALHRLERHQMSPRLCTPVREQLKRMAPALGFGQRFAMRNLWLMSPLVVRNLAEGRTSNPMVRTTTALTMISAGVKENVVAQEARGVVNFRILPCETPEDVLAHARATIDDPDVQIEPNSWTEAAPPGRVDTRAWRVLEGAILEHVPDALVLPGQLSGGTDTRHYRDLADDQYRFIGVTTRMEDVGGVHGTDERVSIEGYARSVDVTVSILRRAAAPETPALAAARARP